MGTFPEDLLQNFIDQSRRILGDGLTGLYLHGSAVMGCFNAQKSDIDLLVVINDNISNGTKRQYMDMVVELNKLAPPKGIELSVVKENVCRPFVYPTPFELHFSKTHLNWYLSNPEDYIAKMKGTDKDLAAHFTITYHRGKTLYGKPIKEVFSEVSKSDYFDSIWHDIENAAIDIPDDPMYFALNLCRVLAYREESLILSKREGGEWALSKLPSQYTGLIQSALREYETDIPMDADMRLIQEFAAYMLRRIKTFAMQTTKRREVSCQ